MIDSVLNTPILRAIPSDFVFFLYNKLSLHNHHAMQSGLHNLISMQQPYTASALAPWAHTGASLGLETFKAYQIASMSTDAAVSSGHMQTAAVAAAANQGMINPMSFATTFALNTASAPAPRMRQQGADQVEMTNGNGGSGSGGSAHAKSFSADTRRPPLFHLQHDGSGSGGNNGAKSTSPSSQEKSGKPNTTSGSDDIEDDANAGRRSSKRKASSSRLGGRKKSRPIPSDDQ